jgi:chemotaxis protein methyltransferase CheR
MENILSILQYREIVNCIKTVYGIDLSNYALTSLRRNIQDVILNSRFKRPEKFLEALAIDKSLLNSLILNLYSDKIVMFRDPAMWRILKHSIIPQIIEKENLKIWMPEVCAEELFTLCVVLKDANLLHNTTIMATSQSYDYIEQIRKNTIEIQEIDQVRANFKRYENHDEVDKYVFSNDKRTYILKELLQKVHFQHFDIFNCKLPVKPNLVLFRNRLLSYNHSMEQKVLNRIYESLPGGGYLIVGVKENLEMFLIQDKFRIIDAEESIYKRMF